MSMLRPFVLVVDDDTAAAERIATWLSRHGYAATNAESVAAARAAMGAVAVDVLLGHLALRDGSLFGLVRSLRMQRPALALGYAHVAVACAPELDACFLAPLDLRALTTYLDARFRRKVSGEMQRVTAASTTRPASPATSAAPQPALDVSIGGRALRRRR